MTTTQPRGPDDWVGYGRLEMRGVARDASTFTQIGTQVIQQLPTEALRSWADLPVPPGMGNLPVQPGLFIGREMELTCLDATLAGNGGAVVNAVHGLGGIGKSSLAAQWAAARAGEFTMTWWINASSAAEVDAGLVALAVALQPAMSGALPFESLREGALQWLAAHQGWLVVLDNVADPADITPLLARVPAGRCLITSRRATGWRGIAVPIRLNVLTAGEAVEMLSAIVTYDGRRDLECAAELCDELGHLPLAIEQAGAFIAETGTTPREYLGLLERYPAAMFDAQAEGGDASRTIARVWNITLDRLASVPLAVLLLSVISWYAPEGILCSLLSEPDPPAVLAALGKLAAYSMLTVNEGTLSIHRLVQAVARTPDPGLPYRHGQAIDLARELATDRLAAAVPTDAQDPSGWPTWRELLPHVEAIARHAQPQTDTAKTAWLLNQAGQFLLNQGAVARATSCHERALAASTRILGETDFATLVCHYNLACDCYMAGDLNRAISTYERVLASCRQVLGDVHPLTISSRSNLALANYKVGHLSQAVAVFEQIIADSERVQGKDHPDVLICRMNLGGVYETAGDLRAAISIYERVLADSIRSLGDDHPQTLALRNNLAAAYSKTGDPGRAIPLYEWALANSTRVLGAHHPQTLTFRNSLARAYEKAGDLDRAIALFEQALNDRRRVLGAEHPDTLTSCDNLAGAYEKAGDLDRAVALFEQALNDRRRVLGAEHPDTLTSCDHLAGAYESANDLIRAVKLYKQAVMDREKFLGADHPDTLMSRSNLAYTFQSAGNPGRAIPMYEQVLRDRLRILGSDHPDTLTSRHNLASALCDVGDMPKGIPLLEELVSDRQRVLGVNHPDVIESRNNLGCAYQLSGDIAKAIQLLEQVLADCMSSLGGDHRQSQLVRTNLAVARAQLAQ